MPTNANVCERFPYSNASMQWSVIKYNPCNFTFNTAHTMKPYHTDFRPWYPRCCKILWSNFYLQQTIYCWQGQKWKMRFIHNKLFWFLHGIKYKLYTLNSFVTGHYLFYSILRQKIVSNIWNNLIKSSIKYWPYIFFVLIFRHFFQNF